MTAANGSYAFTNLADGVYKLQFPPTLPNGKSIVTPNPMTVTLKNSANQIVATTVSAANGSYQFINLALGTYTVSFPPTLPDGRFLGTPNGLTATLTAIGQVFSQADAGYLKPNLNSSSHTILDVHAFAEPNRARIQWVNNTGNRNDFFTLEKLNATTGNFDKTLTINSKSSDVVEVYTAFDDQITEGVNTYRVALTMLNGQVKTSETKTLTFKNINDVRVFPNPASDFIAVDLKQ